MAKISRDKVTASLEKAKRYWAEKEEREAFYTEAAKAWPKTSTASESLRRKMAAELHMREEDGVERQKRLAEKEINAAKDKMRSGLYPLSIIKFFL